MNQLPETTKKAFTEILKSREHASFELEKDSVLMTCGKQQLRLTKDMLKQQDDKENTLIHLTLEKCRANTNKANALALLEQLLLISDAEILNIQNGSCETALHHAVIYFPKNIKLTNLLLERGADPNLTDSQSKTPLHHVATCPVDSYFELGKLLLKHKAEVAISDKDGNTPLHIVARNIQMADIDEDIAKFAELLLIKGVNTRNNEGNTPLHLAAIADNALLATLLLQHNADLGIKNKRGRTALDLAVLYSNARHEEATALLENGGKNLPKPAPKPEFPLIVKRKGTPLLFLLRDEKKHAASVATNTFPNNPDETTFLRVNYANTDFVQALLTKDMELQDLKKALAQAKNPAMIKLLKSKTPLDHLDKDTIEILNTLLKSPQKNKYKMDGDNIVITRGNQILRFEKNVKDDFGSSLLHYAVCAKPENTVLVKLLLDNKVDLNCQNQDGVSPLHTAILVFNYKVAQLLLVEKNTKVNLLTNYGDTPLHYLLREDGQLDLETLKLLVEKGAKANIPNHENATAVELLKKLDLENNPELKQITNELMADLSNEESFQSSSSSTTTEDIIELSSEDNDHKSSEKIIAKNQFFKKEKWDLECKKSDFAYLNTHPEISSTLNQIAAYARHHLDHKLETSRTLQGRAKYNHLAELMFDLRAIEGYDDQERLIAARDLIQQRLDESTKKSELLKNRGGFFGAYQKISSLLNKFGVKHYEYDDRTAVSRTDHYLIKLYDEINSKIVQQENTAN